MNHPVVDFADFRIMHNDTYIKTQEVAQTLALCLMTYVSIDDYHAPDDWSNTSPWISTVGTGGSGMHFRVATQGYQRSMLASHFASYSSCQYNSCYLARAEYQCLKELHHYLTEDFGGPFGHWGEEQVYNYQLAMLELTIKEFKQHYARVDPGFLFDLMKP